MRRRNEPVAFVGEAKRAGPELVVTLWDCRQRQVQVTTLPRRTVTLGRWCPPAANALSRMLIPGPGGTAVTPCRDADAGAPAGARGAPGRLTSVVDPSRRSARRTPRVPSGVASEA